MGAKKKTLSYRLAEFAAPVDRTLEQYIDQAHSIFTNVSQRRVQFQTKPTLECRQHRQATNIGILLHIAAYTPGVEASVVPRVRETDIGVIQTAPPPENCEFMDGDLMVLISGNNVLLCATSLHEMSATRYLSGIIQQAGLGEEAAAFGLTRKANVDKVRLIQRQGVASINLNVSLYDATMMHLERTIERTTVREKLTDAISREVYALIRRDQNPEEIAAAENVTAHLTLTYDRRNKLEVGRREVESLAGKLLEDEDVGYSIKTKHGERISENDISLRKSVSLPIHGQSVYCADAWRELQIYFNELRRDGLLEL